MSLNDSQIAEVQQQIQTLLSSSYNCAVSHDNATNTLVYGKCGVDDSGSNTCGEYKTLRDINTYYQSLNTWGAQNKTTMTDDQKKFVASLANDQCVLPVTYFGQYVKPLIDSYNIENNLLTINPNPIDLKNQYAASIKDSLMKSYDDTPAQSIVDDLKTGLASYQATTSPVIQQSLESLGSVYNDLRGVRDCLNLAGLQQKLQACPTLSCKSALKGKKVSSFSCDFSLPCTGPLPELGNKSLCFMSSLQVGNLRVGGNVRVSDLRNNAQNNTQPSSVTIGFYSCCHSQPTSVDKLVTTARGILDTPFEFSTS